MIWNKLLIDPESRRKLHINVEKEIIDNIDLDKFHARFENQIPVILPKSISPDLDTSEFHHKTHSKFDYLDHYQKDAEEFDYFKPYESSITNDEINRLHQKIVSRIPENAEIILDAGCGNGWLSKQLVNQNRKVISMDISPINPMRALRELDHENHFALVADVFNLPISGDSIDCIIASEIIEHVPNPTMFIDKLLEPLKPGGKLIITTPYNETIEYHLCVHCNKPTPVNAHLHSFNEQNIRHLIPSEIKSWHFSVFGNRYMVKLRFNLLIRTWPFFVWEKMDALANKLIRKPIRLMIEIEK